MRRRVLVTGCSSGFGRTIAFALESQGWAVCATVRKTEDAICLNSIAGSLSLNIMVLDRFDVTSPSITSRIQTLGPFDAVVNNAGYALWGPVEAVSIDEARRQFEVNVLGALRVTQAVLPGMREQGHGRVVNIGSTVTPKLGAGLYAASKAALRALTETLAVEVEPFGINVSLIEPGKYLTMYARNRVISIGDIGAEYLDMHEASAPRRSRDGANAWDVARLVAIVLNDPQPKLFYLEEDVQCSR